MVDRSILMSQVTTHITDLESQFKRLDREFSTQSNQRTELVARKRAVLKRLADALLIIEGVEIHVLSTLIGFPSLPLEAYRINQRFTDRKFEIDQIEATYDFQNATDLIDPVTGDLILKKTEQFGYLEVSRAQLAKFDNNADFNIFHKIYKKGGINPTKSWWIHLWQVITGQVYAYNKLKKWVLKHYQFDDAESLFEGYNQVGVGINEFQDSVNNLSQKISRVQAVQSQHAKLTAGYANRKSIVMNEVYEKVLSHLSSVQDFTRIRLNLSSEYGILTGTILALSEQIKLMSTSIDALRIELADREKMINDLNTLKIKLNRSRNSSVKGDISGKLNLTLKNSQTRTDHYITRSSAFTTRVYSYNSYDDYDHELSLLADDLNTVNLLYSLMKSESTVSGNIQFLSQDLSEMFSDSESTANEIPNQDIDSFDGSLDFTSDIQSIIEEITVEHSSSYYQSSASTDQDETASVSYQLSETKDSDYPTIEYSYQDTGSSPSSNE
jgi:hypothetical protein